jgi:hypothetical protein
VTKKYKSILGDITIHPPEKLNFKSDNTKCCECGATAILTLCWWSTKWYSTFGKLE